jgi:hypothetical protein
MHEHGNVSSVLAPQDTMHIVCSFTFFTSSCRFQRKCRKGRLSLNKIKLGWNFLQRHHQKEFLRLSESITVRLDVCCHIKHCEDCWNTPTVKTGEVIIRRRKNKNLQIFSFTVAEGTTVSIKLRYIHLKHHHKDTAECNSMLWNDTKTWGSETRKQINLLQYDTSHTNDNWRIATRIVASRQHTGNPICCY